MVEIILYKLQLLQNLSVQERRKKIIKGLIFDYELTEGCSNKLQVFIYEIEYLKYIFKIFFYTHTLVTKEH